MNKRLEIKHYKVKSVLEATVPNSVFYVKSDTDSDVSVFITSLSGEAIPIKDLTGGGSGSGVQSVVNIDGSITVTGTSNIVVSLSASLLSLVNSALQSADPISSLTNDSGYITLSDIPTFDPSNYDLADFTNTSLDVFVRESDIGTVAQTNSYNDLDDVPTTFTPSSHTHVEADITDLDKYTQSEVDTLLNDKFDNPTGNNSQYLDGAGVATTFPTIPSGNTNLSYTASSTNGTVTSDTGTDATIPLADNANAGLLKPAKYSLLEQITEAFTTTLKTAYDSASTWVTSVGIQLKTDFDALIATGSRLITSSEITKLGNTSGTNTGDETTANIKTKLGVATTATDGYLISTDWNTFNNKQQNLKNFYKTKGILYHEEFIGSQGGSVSTSYGQVVTLASGTGSDCRTTSTITNRTNQQGVVRHNTGSTATGVSGYTYGNQNLFLGLGTISIETYITIDTLSTVTDRFFTIFGYIVPSNWQNSSNGIFISYDEGGSIFFTGTTTPNWRCFTKSGGTVNATTTSIAVVATQWYKLRVDINTMASSVSFYIDNVLVATHTTQIPLTTTAMSVISTINKTIGTNARTMQSDYFSYEELFMSVR